MLGPLVVAAKERDLNGARELRVLPAVAAAASGHAVAAAARPLQKDLSQGMDETAQEGAPVPSDRQAAGAALAMPATAAVALGEQRRATIFVSLTRARGSNAVCRFGGGLVGKSSSPESWS